VQSLELPLRLNLNAAVLLSELLTLIRMLAAGDARTPLKLTTTSAPATV
jgi:hypothetical protein